MPLRERSADMPLLAGYFCERSRVNLGLDNLSIQPQALELLSRYAWPGNVRELEHAIYRAAVLARAEQGSRRVVIRHGHFNLTPGQQAEAALSIVKLSPGLSFRAATDEFQSRLIRQALAHCSGNWAAAARHLDLDAGNLHRMAKRLGIK